MTETFGLTLLRRASASNLKSNKTSLAGAGSWASSLLGRHTVHLETRVFRIPGMWETVGVWQRSYQKINEVEPYPAGYLASQQWTSL